MQSILFLACAILCITAESGCTKAARKARLLEQANKYFAAGEYEKAEIDYKNVLQLGPVDPDAISHLAIIYFNQGRSGMYASYLAKAHELQPDNLDVRVKLATVDNSIGKFADARTQAQFVLAQRPNDAEAVMVLANTARQPAEFDEVRQLLEKLPSANTAPVLAAEASLYLRQAKFAEAESLLTRAQTLQPKSSEVAMGFGALYGGKNDFAAAEKAFANASAWAPPRSSAPIRYAEVSLRLGKADQAKRIMAETTSKFPDFLPAWLLLAQMAENEKKPDDCLSDVAKVLALDEVHHDAWMMSVRAHLAKGEVDEALSELTRLQKTFPKSPILLYELGVAYTAKGERESAIAALNQSLAITPDATGASELLAGIYLRSGSPGLAVKLLAALAQRHRELAQVRLLLAQALRAQGNLGGALSVYEQMEKDFRANPQLGYYEGLIYIEQKKNDEARRSFTKALAIDPANLLVTEQLVNLDLDEKNYAAALARVDAMLTSNPKSADAYALRAHVFAVQNLPKQVESNLQQVVNLTPESPLGYFLLAQLYIQTKEDERAMTNLQESIAKDPKAIQPLLMLAAIQDQRKNYKEARATYEKLLALNPRSVLVLNNLAFLNSEVFNDLDKAASLAQEARKQNPNSPDVGDTLGWIFYKKHDYARALPLLTDSAEKLPTNPGMQYHFGMTAYMMGDEQQAKAALERAMGLKSDFDGSAEAKRALAIIMIDPKKDGPSGQATVEKAAAGGTDPIALIRLGAYYEQAGAIDKAATSYEAVLKASPSSIGAALGMIRIDLLRKETAKALDLAKATRNRAPDNPELAHALGRLAFATGDRTWAFSLLQESARKLSDDPEVLSDLADAAYSKGQVAAAEEALQGALAAHPSATLAARDGAMLETIQLADDPARAVAATAKIDERLKSDPADVPALMALGIAQEKRADPFAAEKTYEKILARYDDFAPAQRNLTIIFSRRTAVEPTAIEVATKAREAFPNDPEVSKAFGILLVHQGNFIRAAVLLQESAQKLATDAEVMYYLGLAQNGLKDSKASAKSLQRALELGLGGDLAVQAKKLLAPANGKP